MTIDYNTLAKQFGATSSDHPVTGPVDYSTLAAKYGEAPTSAVTPAKSAPPQDVGSAGQTLETSSTLTDKLKALPSQLADAVKTFLTGNYGEELASGFGADIASKNNLSQVQQEAQNLQTAIQARNKLTAAGVDTSHADAMIADIVRGGLGKGSSVNEVVPHATDTNTEAILNSVQTAAAPFVDLTKPAVSAASSALTSTATKAVPVVQKLAIGTGGVKTVEELSNPAAQAFTKGKTFSAVVDATQKAIDSFVSQSKASLQAVKQSIPDVKIDPSRVGTAVNDAVMRSIESSASYRGVEGARLFNSPTELINSGLMNADEVAKTKGMINAISNWKDFTARGLLNLKEQLAPFYTDGLNNSNAVLRNIQNSLKDIVATAAPKIKPALQTASDNIDLAEQFQKHLIGTNTVTGESKLASLARGLSNPAANAERINLLQQLAEKSGYSPLKELKGYNDYLDLLKKGNPTKFSTYIKEGGKRLGIAGGITAGLAELHRLFGGQ